MSPWPLVPIPGDVLTYVEDAFTQANERVARQLDAMPTLHEEHLDFSFIGALSERSGPRLLPSGVIVDFDVHFVGGGGHWARWEVADLGVIVNFRLQGVLFRTKVILLQSKRLYPVESEFVEDAGLSRSGGFGSLMAQPRFAAMAPRNFRFDRTCRYKALQVGDDQWRAIHDYEETYQIPVHYLLYHPSTLPCTREIPVPAPAHPRRAQARVGARVLSATDLRALVSGRPRNYAPSYADLSTGTGGVGLRVQQFFRDEVLSCRQGYVTGNAATDIGLDTIFNRRTAPIAAAIRFDINFPESMGEQLTQAL